ncbi:MAG: SDR family oxidoreductase, partial [Anaerolineae bacterium]
GVYRFDTGNNKATVNYERGGRYYSETLNKWWGMSFGGARVRVYEVRPGVIATDMTSGVQAKYDALIADGLTVEPRWGYPEDVGRAVAALARGDLPYATGTVIMVDGGLTIPRL